jgi:hypothetical protein
MLILKTVQVTYMMKHSSPLMGHSAPDVNRHTGTCGGRHILRVVTPSPQPANQNQIFAELYVHSSANMTIPLAIYTALSKC